MDSSFFLQGVNEDDILVGTRVEEGEDLLEVQNQIEKGAGSFERTQVGGGQKRSVICLFGRWNSVVKCWLTGGEDPCRGSFGRWKFVKGQGPSPS